MRRLLFGFIVLLFSLTYGFELQTDTVTIDLSKDVKEHNSVSFQKWIYYKFTVPAHKGFTLYIEHAKGTSKNHDVDVFVRKGGLLPDRTTYDYYDINILNNITIDGLAENQDTVFIAGIYGFSGLTTTPFTIMYRVTNGCPQDCNSFGICRRDNVCSCFTGHVGTYCQYSSTSVNLGQTYTASLRSNNWAYYYVDVFAANNLEIHVTQTGGDVDLYLHYQSVPDFINYEYAEISTSSDYTLTVSEPLLGTWHIGFFAFNDASYTFTVSEQRSCPMNCSLHGSCIGSVCHCVPGFTGLSCEEATSNLNTTATHGYVAQNFWNFYQYRANSDNPFLVRVNQKDKNTNCDLYIMNGAKPTRFIYQYTNVTLAPDTEILVSHPGNDLWWIGVYGTSACEYDIHVNPSQVISVCGNCNLQHGHCNSDNLCICDEGWFGIECSVNPVNLTNGQRTSPQTIGNRQWNYFAISVSGSSLLTIIMNEQTTSGLGWVYLSKETFPTLDAYEAADNAIISNHRITVEFPTPTTHRFVIGVYGSPYILNPIQYSLVVYYTPF